MITRRVVLSVLAGMPALFGQTKRSVAVEDFDFSTVRDAGAAIFGTQVDLGKGMSALMVKRIAQGGKFTVVERNKVGTVLKEQDFGASGRVKKGTQARIGQIRGADFTIMGDVVVFGRDDRRRSGAAGVIVPGAGGVGGMKNNEAKAVVVLNFRMVDNESSEIVMTGEARGESKRSSRGGFAGVFVGGVGAGGGVDFTNFADTIIGEAVIDACDKLAAQVNAQAGGVSSTRQIDIEGRVAAVEGDSVYINVGSSAGVQMGDTFEVSRIVKEVKDPVTKEVLDVVTAPVGSLKITSVREKIAIGSFSGGQPPKEGDRVEKK
jgi:curli biogenesis system outer membrane secretion channel CsgG